MEESAAVRLQMNVRWKKRSSEEDRQTVPEMGRSAEVGVGSAVGMGVGSGSTVGMGVCSRAGSLSGIHSSQGVLPIRAGKFSEQGR